MKKILSLIAILLSYFLFSQSEKISLNFFARNLVPQLKKTIVCYDGKVIDKSDYEKPKKNSDDETTIENILWDVFITKDDRRGISNKNTDFAKTFDYGKVVKFANTKNSTSKILVIPKNILFRKVLKSKDRKAGKMRYKINKIFPQKYNLKVSPSIEIGENIYLTRLWLTKQDDADGSYFDIIAKDNKIVDWVEISWVQ